MLGPIEIGDGARIGSNAVVVKSVPEGATVVGIPGRLVERRPAGEHVHREQLARKMGFDAYGATRDAPDPVANAINCMLDHVHVLETKVSRMCEVLKGMGYEEEDVSLPELSSCEIVSTAEELHHMDNAQGGEEGVAKGKDVGNT
ncbi:MAG TPA: hypothetical protein EYP90_13555 [Chromatiaceae bacterium]|nr:hypothetical protein [Chromatiaceae bacterium]